MMNKIEVLICHQKIQDAKLKNLNELISEIEFNNNFMIEL